VRAVGVHLDKQRRALVQPDPECILISAPDAELALAMQDTDPAVATSELVRELPCPVGRRVIHNEHVVTEVPDAGDDPFQVLPLVEGGQHDENFSRRRLALREPATAAHTLNLSLMTCFSMSSELRTAFTFVGEELRQTTGTSAILTPCLRAR